VTKLTLILFWLLTVSLAKGAEPVLDPELSQAFDSVSGDANSPSPVVAKVLKRRTILRPKKGGEKAVDLSKMNNAPPKVEAKAAPASESPTRAVTSHHMAPGVEPHFNIFFDLWLAYQPGKAELSFLNFHPLLLLEVVPLPDLQFSFEVNPSPRYYELDYRVNEWLQFRAGKIWIPFDDMNPHNLFGGMIATSRLRLGTMAYLPDIWTDLGVGAKFNIIEQPNLNLDGHLYVVNGFGGGGTDPMGQSANYPLFNDIPVSASDTNNNKAIGGRLHALIDRTFGLGLSFYTGQWTPDGPSDSRSIYMVGLDAQIRKGRTEYKLGFSYMPVALLGDVGYHRQGQYLEVNQKFGKQDEWRLTGRVGHLDPDSRLTDDNDTLTVGAGLRWKPGMVAFAFEHYQDVKKVAIKKGYSFTAFRSIIQL